MRAMVYWDVPRNMARWVAGGGLATAFRVSQQNLVDATGAGVMPADEAAWTAYLSRGRIRILAEDRFRVAFDLARALPSCVVFGDYELDGEALESDIRSEGAGGIEFAAVCTTEEFEARNLWRSQWSTELVGVDASKYAPGLYWWTYLSDDYAARHHLDLDPIISQCDQTREAARGRAIQMYRHADDWRKSEETVQTLIRDQDGFFDIRRIPAFSGQSITEFLDFAHDELVKWP